MIKKKKTTKKKQIASHEKNTEKTLDIWILLLDAK